MRAKGIVPKKQITPTDMKTNLKKEKKSPADKITPTDIETNLKREKKNPLKERKKRERKKHRASNLTLYV